MLRETLTLPDEVVTALSCTRCGAGFAADRAGLRCADGHTLRVVEWLPLLHSHVLHLRDGEDRCLLLKVPLVAEGEGAVVDSYGATDEGSLRRQVEREKEAMRFLARRLGDGPHRVPELVPGAVRGRSILMRCAEGANLRDMLHGSASWMRAPHLALLFERAALWLAATTEATTTIVAPFDPSELLERTQFYLEDMRAHGHAADDAGRLEAAVRELATRAEGEPLARCFAHKDFRAGHVYVGRHTTTVIDFEQAGEGWAHEDAAFFLASIDGFSARNPVRRWSPGGRVVTRRFLDAYLVHSAPGWAEVGSLFRVASMIRALRSNYRGRLARTRSHVFRRVVVPHYQRWFDRWLSAPDED